METQIRELFTWKTELKMQFYEIPKMRLSGEKIRDL